MLFISFRPQCVHLCWMLIKLPNQPEVLKQPMWRPFRSSDSRKKGHSKQHNGFERIKVLENKSVAHNMSSDWNAWTSVTNPLYPPTIWNESVIHHGESQKRISSSIRSWETDPKFRMCNLGFRWEISYFHFKFWEISIVKYLLKHVLFLPLLSPWVLCCCCH